MRRDARTIKDEAAVAAGKGRWKQALGCYLELETAEPGDGAWARRAGDVQRRLGDNAAALASYDRAAQRYAASGFLVQAIAVCKVMLQLDPSHADTLARLAAMHAQRGIPTASASDRRNATAAAPSSNAPLDSMSLGAMVPGSQATLKDGVSSGMIVIPLDDELGIAPAVDPWPDARANADNDVDVDMDIDAETGGEISVDVDLTDAVELSAAAERALRTTPLFSGLGPAALETLIERVELVTLVAGQVLFHQGDAGNTLYVIVDGEVAVLLDGPPRVELSRLRSGDFFGEIALVTEQPRTATIAAVTASELLAVDRDTLGALLAAEPAVLQVVLRFLRDRLLARLVRTSPLFQPLSARERRELTARVRFLEVEPGAVLIEQGQRAAGLYVLMAGEAHAIRAEAGGERLLTRLGAGDLCGEMSLLAAEPAVATVRSVSKVLALELPAAAFRELIMTHSQVLAYVAELAETRQRELTGAAPDTRGVWSDSHIDLL